MDDGCIIKTEPELERPAAAHAFELPLDDGAIARAMADLNSKLSAWAAALTQARAVRPAPKLSAKTQTRTSAAPARPTKARPSKAASACGTQPKSAAKQHFGSVRAAATVATPGKLTDEDEAMLATLDPEIANSIRIERRLNGGTESIRELVKRMQQERLETTETTKRSGGFWRKWSSQ